ncbi:hypothetical protein OG900_32830 [Streptomyces sp. NBC_00433]
MPRSTCTHCGSLNALDQRVPGPRRRPAVVVATVTSLINLALWWVTDH